MTERVERLKRLITAWRDIQIPTPDDEARLFAELAERYQANALPRLLERVTFPIGPGKAIGDLELLISIVWGDAFRIGYMTGAAYTHLYGLPDHLLPLVIPEGGIPDG